MMRQVRTWEEWGELYTDIKAWQPVIADVAARHCLLCKDIRLPVPGTSAVFVLDSHYVIKFYPAFLTDDYKKERIALQFLSSNMTVRKPIYEGCVETFGQNFPYIIMPCINGQTLRENQMETGDRHRVFLQVGRWMKNLHSLSLNSMSASDTKQIRLELSAGTILPEIKKEIQHLSFLNPALIWPELKRFLNQELNNIQEMNECLTHGDLTPEHIYIKRKNGRAEFAEVIDWGDAKIAPPVYDFVTFWMTVCNRERECFQSFLEGYAEGKSLNGQLMLAMIFLHPFRQDLILEAWEQDGRQPFFNSWEELSEWLWPLQNEK